MIEKEYIELLMLRNFDKNIIQKELFNKFGFSIDKINYILNNLIDKGLVKVERFINNNTNSKIIKNFMRNLKIYYTRYIK